MLQIIADSLMVATRLHPEPTAVPRRDDRAEARAPRRWFGWTRALFAR